MSIFFFNLLVIIIIENICRCDMNWKLITFFFFFYWIFLFCFFLNVANPSTVYEIGMIWNKFRTVSRSAFEEFINFYVHSFDKTRNRIDTSSYTYWLIYISYYNKWKSELSLKIVLYTSYTHRTGRPCTLYLLLPSVITRDGNRNESLNEL